MCGASVHWYEKTQVKAQRKMGHITIVAPNILEVVEIVPRTFQQLLTSWFQLQRRMDLIESGKSSSSSASTPTPLVGIIMGSDSDLPKMKAAAEVI